MFSDHLKTCKYCRNEYHSKVNSSKPTISVKSASSYSRRKKLSELAAIIKGISYPSLEPLFQTKSASFENNFNRPGPIEREVKLKALAKIIRG